MVQRTWIFFWTLYLLNLFFFLIFHFYLIYLFVFCTYYSESVYLLWEPLFRPKTGEHTELPKEKKLNLHHLASENITPCLYLSRGGCFGLVTWYAWLVSNPVPLSLLSLLPPLILPRTSLATRTPVSAWRTCWPPCPEWSLFHPCLEAAFLHTTWPQGGRWVVDLAAATRTTLAATAPWGNRPPQGRAPLGLAQLSLLDKVKRSVIQKLQRLSGIVISSLSVSRRQCETDGYWKSNKIFKTKASVQLDVINVFHTFNEQPRVWMQWAFSTLSLLPYSLFSSHQQSTYIYYIL